MSICKARQYSDQMLCACGLAWDVNDPEPPECRRETAASAREEERRAPVDRKRQLAQLRAELDGVKAPGVLFDGYRVLQALDDKARARTSAENVSDVLDAVVRIMREEAASHG